MSAKFIVFEGIDGAGKTTQVELLVKRMEKEGRKPYLTAEPTGLATGKEIRRVLGGEIKKSDCEMATMFVLDRIAHNKDSEIGIDRMIEEGFDVISDRYYYSSLAYQGSSTDYSWVRAMNIDCPEIRKPDLCIFLDLTPEQSLERIRAGRNKLEIYENVETLTKVRESFFSTFSDLDDKVAIVNAYRSIEEIADEIWQIVSSIL